MDVTSAQNAALLTASAARPMPDALIDAETTRLAVEAERGDPEAFCALVDLHRRAAGRVAMAALGNAADADEVVQEACITAWRQIGRLEDAGAFRAWLLRITWRKALDRRRSVRTWLKRFQSTMSGPRDGTAIDVLASVADRAAAADDQLLARERDQVVAQLIRSLPARLRDPFLLAAGGDHRYDDIAGLLGIPLGSVKWRVAEARRVLREKLARMGFR